VVWTKWGDRQSPKISQRKNEYSGLQVVVLCHWVSFLKFLKTLKVEISIFLQISRTTNPAMRHILEDLNLQQHSCGNLKYQKQTVLHYC